MENLWRKAGTAYAAWNSVCWNTLLPSVPRHISLEKYLTAPI